MPTYWAAAHRSRAAAHTVHASSHVHARTAPVDPCMMCGPGPVRRPLLAFVPVMAGLPNLAMPLEQHVGNAVSGYLLALPVNEPDPLKQLERIRRQTSAAKRARVAIFAGLLAVFTHAHMHTHVHTCLHTVCRSYTHTHACIRTCLHTACRSAAATSPCLPMVRSIVRRPRLCVWRLISPRTQG